MSKAEEKVAHPPAMAPAPGRPGVGKRPAPKGQGETTLLLGSYQIAPWLKRAVEQIDGAQFGASFEDGQVKVHLSYKGKVYKDLSSFKKLQKELKPKAEKPAAEQKLDASVFQIPRLSRLLKLPSGETRMVSELIPEGSVDSLLSAETESKFKEVVKKLTISNIRDSNAVLGLQALGATNTQWKASPYRFRGDSGKVSSSS